MGLVKRTMEYLDKESFCPLYKSLVRPHIEYANSVWNPYLKKFISAIENVQKRATKLVPGIYNISYKERLKHLNFPNLSYRRYSGDMIEVFKTLNGLYDSSVTNNIFSIKNTATRENTLKTFKEGCHTELRRNFFTQRIVD